MTFHDPSLFHVVINKLKILSTRISDLKLKGAVNLDHIFILSAV